MTDPLTCRDASELAASFVLGALDAGEAARVRDHLATCPNPHPEFAELGGVVSHLGEALEPVEPPASLRARIMAQAAADLETGVVRRGSAPATSTPMSSGAAAGAVPGSAQVVAGSPQPTGAEPASSRIAAPRGQPPRPIAATAPGSGRIVSLPRDRGRRRAGAWVLAIAAAVAIVALAGWNVVLQSDLGSARDYQASIADAITLAAQPGSRLAVLAPTREAPGSPSGLAVLPATGTGRVVMRGLSQTTGSQVYEAWTIAKGGAPQPAGGFTVGANGIGVLDGLSAGAADGVTIAITLEPRPNPVTPTLPIISSGIATTPAS